MKRYIKTSESSKKYYVIRNIKDRVEYKRTKTRDYWSKTPDGCWQYSKQGAERIAEQYNARVHPNNKSWVSYGIEEVNNE